MNADNHDQTPHPADPIREQLDNGPQAAGQARSAVRRALDAWGMSELTDDAELLTSELVANAAEHAEGQPVGLAIFGRAGEEQGITCEVSDSSPVIPIRRLARSDDERGRGLAIVAALASDSGVRARPDGKTSWFTLALRERTARLCRDMENDPEPGA